MLAFWADFQIKLDISKLKVRFAIQIFYKVIKMVYTHTHLFLTRYIGYVTSSKDITNKKSSTFD